MNQSVNKAVAAIYEERRDRADRMRRQKQAEIYQSFPELEQLDREIAVAGADLLFEAIDPDRPKEAGDRRDKLLIARDQFLDLHNIDIDFDQPVYECTLCNDTGINGNGKCICYRRTLMPLLVDHANLKALKDITFDKFDPELFSDKPEQSDKGTSPRSNILAIMNAVLAFADRIGLPADAPERTKGQDNLLFLGRPGTGKSFLMACLANEMLIRGETVFYVSAPELFEILNELRVLQSSFSPDPVRLEQISSLYDSIIHARLLLIDDLGTETRGGVRYSELLTLIDRRLSPGLHTVISSNADAAALKQVYDERLLSRFMGNYAIYRFFGEDIRLELSRRRRSRS